MSPVDLVSPIGRWLKVAAAVIALLVLAWCLHAIYQMGYDARDTIAVKERAAAVESAVKELKDNMADARQRDARTISTLQAQTRVAQATQAGLQAHLAAQAALPYDRDATKPPLLGQCVLDDATVRLLNDARAARPGADGGAAERGDAPQPAASQADAQP